MSGSAFWEHVAADGHRVPSERPLAELTTELTAMLGATDQYIREELAFGTLATWLADGVYDGLLEGLGDGMAAGLVVGLGTTASDTVLRRSYSAKVLAECLRRDNEANLMTADTVLRWGDRVMSWLVRERDLRGHVPGRGLARAVAHGADALAVLAESEHLGRLELTVLLDVVADRLTVPTSFRMLQGEDDRLAATTMAILRRNVLPMDVLDPWVTRLVEAAAADDSGAAEPYVVTGNLQAFLRSLHLQLALSPEPPECRADLLLSLIAGLRRTNSPLLG